MLQAYHSCSQGLAADWGARGCPAGALSCPGCCLGSLLLLHVLLVPLAAANKIFPAVGDTHFAVNANQVGGSWQAQHLPGLSLALSL